MNSRHKAIIKSIFKRILNRQTNSPEAGSQKMNVLSEGFDGVTSSIKGLCNQVKSQTLVCLNQKNQWYILLIMFAQQNIEQLPTKEQGQQETWLSGKNRPAKKEKKISKPFEKNAQRHGRGKEWSKVQKVCYARLLLTSIVHSISIGTQFIDYMAQEISRKPQEVYAFHRKMISEFRTNRSIVKQLLGSELPQSKPRSTSFDRFSPLNKPQAPQKRCCMSQINSSQQLDELSLNDSWLMVEKGPEVMGQGWEEQMEIHEYVEDLDTEYKLDVDDSFQAYTPLDWSSQTDHGMGWSL